MDAAHEDARRLSSLYLQANGLGWVRDRPAQLFVLDVPDVFGEPPVTPKGRAAGDAGADEPRRGGVPARGDRPPTPPTTGSRASPRTVRRCW
ncbi:MAG: hypothetical protein R2719_06270 [Micropruina sp.]